MVGEQADVLEELEGHVQGALREGRGVEDLVLPWLGASEKRAHPGVHWEEAEEAEGHAGAGEEGGEGGYGGCGCGGGGEGRACGGDGAGGEFGEEAEEAGLEGADLAVR